MRPNVLPTRSILNARDLGGYLGHDGRKIKYKRLLRTGTISNVSEEDQFFLQQYGLRKIINLRSLSETKENPDAEMENTINYLMPLSKEDGTLGEKDNSIDKYHKEPMFALQEMIRYYRDHVIEEHDRNIVRQVLNIMTDTEEGSIIFHCTEGKDRTGFVAFFILYILGVDLETIRQDYLFSNDMLQDYRAIRDQKFENAGENLIFRTNMRVLSSAHDILFDTILLTIEQQFGSIDEYIENQLEITPELRKRICELYLEE